MRLVHFLERGKKWCCSYFIRNFIPNTLDFYLNGIRCLGINVSLSPRTDSTTSAVTSCRVGLFEIISDIHGQKVFILLVRNLCNFQSVDIADFKNF